MKAVVEQYPDRARRDPGSVVTVGVFDGVHVGHRAILDRVVARAQAVEGPATVVTFDPHPQEVISGDITPLLTTMPERIQLLGGAGVQRVVVIPFTRDFSRVPPEEFVGRVLFEGIGFQEIVVGYDHGFGRDRRGDTNLLERLAGQFGFDVHEMEARTTDHTPVSSSVIRELLVKGDLSGARELLGRRYSISGKVTKGDGRGRVIGFPTANVQIGNRRKLIPQRGVYAVRVRIGDGPTPHRGMMNIGFRPTFDGSGLRLEVHIFDLDKNLYGDRLQIEFVERVRDERKFDGMDPLRAQLKEDEARCRRALESVP